jgi:protein-S-isoprenylcysteine O-methyltransferase Ste14
MTVQPPGPQQQAPEQQLFVADRRSPERRAYDRRAEDRAQFIRTAVAAAMAICGGLAVLFVFFWALGAIDVKDAVAATIVAVVLAGVWLAGFLYRRRLIHEDLTAQRVSKQDRERRGF